MAGVNIHAACAVNSLIYMLITVCIFVPCLLSCTYRKKLRNKFDLPESPAPDCIIHFLCEWCALCQEHRELELRGLDPSLGTYEHSLSQYDDVICTCMMAYGVLYDIFVCCRMGRKHGAYAEVAAKAASCHGSPNDPKNEWILNKTKWLWYWLSSLFPIKTKHRLGILLVWYALCCGMLFYLVFSVMRGGEEGWIINV